MPRPAIVWLRLDLRLEDNPALMEAAKGDRPIIPLFIYDGKIGGRWAIGAASKWWLHHSLLSLEGDLGRHKRPLVIREGDAEDVLLNLAKEVNAEAVCWNAVYEPAIRERDDRIAEALRDAEIEPVVKNGCLLHHPDDVQTGSGGPYKVFTPFWKKLREEVEIGEPLECPTLRAPDKDPDGSSVDDLKLLPKIDWDGGFRETWDVGTAAAEKKLDAFLMDGLAEYGEMRDRPDVDGTSQLSPHLHFGEISPRQVYAKVKDYVDKNSDASDGADTYLSEIGWREFAYHVLYHFPDTPNEPLRDKFQKMPWKDDKDGLKAWQKGQTGYPIVDAGMRQLWHIGWMHNRVRMIVGSFLTKDQLISWERGADWFFDCLCDGDLASNTLGWQWVSGCGADAAPYFRIFNPITQGEKFDPDGAYIRRWVPELQDLPDAHIHAPWEAPDDVIKKAGIELGSDYASPIVDHKRARERALEALEKTK